MARQIQKAGAGAAALQVGGDLHMGLTDNQIGPLGEAVARSLWERLGGSASEVAAKFREASEDINSANRAVAEAVEAAFRRKIADWTDTRLQTTNVKSFLHVMSSINKDLSDRKDYGNPNLYLDTSVIFSWMDNPPSYENQLVDYALSSSLVPTLINDSRMNVTNSVSRELRHLIEKRMEAQREVRSARDFLTRFQTIKGAMPNLEVTEGQVSIGVIRNIETIENALVESQRSGPVRTRMSYRNDATSVATIMALNERPDAPRAVFVTLDRLLIRVFDRLRSQGLVPPSGPIVRDIYGATWGASYTRDAFDGDAGILAPVAQAITACESHLRAFFHRRPDKSDLPEIRHLHSTIEAMAAQLEKFHSDLYLGVCQKHEATARSLLKFIRQIEAGEHVLSEVVAFLIHYLGNLPAPEEPESRSKKNGFTLNGLAGSGGAA